MRVLHISSGNLYGGIETMLLGMAKHASFCPQMEPSFALCFHGRLFGQLAESGATVFDLGAVRVRQPWSVWEARRRLASICRRERFDWVICHSPWPHAIFGHVARRTGQRLAFWLHDYIDGSHWLQRWAKRTPPDLAIANSRFTGAGLTTLFGESVSTMVSYPIVAQRATALPRSRVRHDFGIRQQDVLILQMSRFEEWKGHRVLLTALGRLRDESNWQCWIAGTPQRPAEQAYERELRRMAERFGIESRVRFLGHREDTHLLLAAADIYCQPNTGPEPYGLVFLEAMQAGVPVVTSNLGAAREILTAECGILTESDAGSLARELLGLLHDPRRRTALGAGGPARARAIADPVARLNELYASLAAVGQPA